MAFAETVSMLCATCTPWHGNCDSPVLSVTQIDTDWSRFCRGCHWYVLGNQITAACMSVQSDNTAQCTMN